MKLWNYRWARIPDIGYKTMATRIPVSNTISHNLPPIIHRKIIRVRMNRTYLQSHKKLYAPLTDGNCSVCNKSEDIEHVLTTCIRYQPQIRELTYNYHKITATNGIIDIYRILGLIPNQNKNESARLLQLLANFIKSTNLNC